MNELSVIILTQNEEENIKRAIESVKEISTDIVIVDSGSTDRTSAIAKKLGARVFSHKLESFAAQRNFANSKTRNKWVLSMDADEEIPDDLREEVKSTLNNPLSDAYLIPRRNIIFGKEIKHTRWSPDAHIWLYNKDQGMWEGDVHEEFVTRGRVGAVKHGKLHHSHKSVTDFLKMVNHYTNIEADIIIKSGRKSSIIHMLYYAVKSFIGRFFVKRGYLDGKHGFVLSVLMGFYRFSTWAKVWERQNI